MTKITKTTASRVWVLQAYLAVSPSRPHWAGVSWDGVVGAEKYRWWTNDYKCLHDPRLDDGTGWTFISAEAALSVLQELVSLPQKYYLRVVEQQTVFTEVALGGFDIEDGTVVRKPSGEYPSFMRKLVPNCRDDLPSLMSA